MDHSRRFRIHFGKQQDKIDWFLSENTGRGLYTDIALYLIQPCWSIEFKDARQAPDEDWAGRPFVIRCNPLGDDRYLPMGVLEALQRIADPNALTGLLMLEEPASGVLKSYGIHATTTMKELRVVGTTVELHGEFITDPSIGSIPAEQQPHRDFGASLSWWRSHKRMVDTNIQTRQRQAHLAAHPQVEADDSASMLVVSPLKKQPTSLLDAQYTDFNQTLISVHRMAGLLKLNDQPMCQEHWAVRLRLLDSFRSQWRDLPR
jgi:hypothetical protein